MALAIQCSVSVKQPSSFRRPSLPAFSTKFRLTVKASESPFPTSEEPKPANEGTTPSNKSGVGFGSSPSIPPKDVKKKQKGRERGSVIRRTPLEKPLFLSQKGDAQQPQKPSRGETVFLLTWLGLGSLILLEGLILAASGLLPEEWDIFLVKYLYPLFTPTVFFFVTGTVVYGVLKYLQLDQRERLK